MRQKCSFFDRVRCVKPLYKKEIMCYNKMYAFEFPGVGQAVQSRMGHDKGRIYLIAAVVGKDFVLLTDGDKRPLAKLKTKRVKHLKPLGESEQAKTAFASGGLTDSAVRKILKEFSGNAKN